MNTGYYPFRWIRIAFVTLLAVIAAAILFSVVYGILNPAQSSAFPRFGFLWFGPFFWFGWIFIFLFIFGALRWLFWPWRGRGYYWQRFDPAMQALRERYARGEITKEQFEQMAKDLQSN